MVASSHEEFILYPPADTKTSILYPPTDTKNTYKA